MTAQPTNPWHMLAPLDGERSEERELLELTRAEELHVINNVVAAARVSLLYAMSGNGKTSLIHAGVIPFFRRHGHAVFTTRPRPPFARHDPRRAFRECILRQLPDAVKAAHDAAALKSLDEFIDTTQRTELKAFADRFRLFAQTMPADPEIARTVGERVADVAHAPLPEFMSRVADLLGRDRPILVVCDQFEELFVHFANDVALQQFIEELGALWAESSLNVRLLFSMREDWVGSMIAFRRVIPDIFKDTFRLQPLTTTHARHVLTAPLESRGLTFPADGADRILRDLASVYHRVEKRRLGGVEPDDAEPETQFVELPALHLVASKLWETRNHPKPFSAEHYLSLPAAETERGKLSPAETILTRFLTEALSPKEHERSLQLDTLYLLTDGERHRRASSTEAIARAIQRLRPRQLFASLPTVAQINDAIAPLVAKGLVRCLEGPEGLEYELGHDYLVRAVVRTWRELDRTRAKELGRLARDQEEKELRLQSLEAKTDRVRQVLQVLPAFILVGLIWTAVKVDAPDFNAMIVNPARPGPALLIFLPSIVLLIAGVFNRHRLSIGIAAIALVASWTAAFAVEAVRHDQWPRLDLPTGLLGWAAPVIAILWIRLAAQLQASRRSRLFFAVWWAELIDLLLSAGVVIAAGAITDEVTRGNTPVAVMLVLSAAAVFGLRVWYLVRKQSTVGLTWIGLGLTPADRAAPAGIGHALAREFAFAIWAAINTAMFLTPWLLASSFVCWLRGRTIPDLVTGLAVAPRARTTPPKQVPEAAPVAAYGDATGLS